MNVLIVFLKAVEFVTLFFRVSLNCFKWAQRGHLRQLTQSLAEFF